MSVAQTLRNLFKTADSISIDDTFYRYFNNSVDDCTDTPEEVEINLTFGDARHTFRSDDLDNAIFNDSNSDDPNTFYVQCSYTGYSVTLSFYSVSLIKPVIKLNSPNK